MTNEYGPNDPNPPNSGGWHQQGGQPGPGWQPQQPAQQWPQQGGAQQGGAQQGGAQQGWQPQQGAPQQGAPQQGWQPQNDQSHQGQPQQNWQAGPDQQLTAQDPSHAWQQAPAGWQPGGAAPTPGRKRNLGVILTAVVVVVALAVGVTFFFISRKGTTAAGGASTPEAAVSAALSSFQTGDSVSLLESLDPAEAQPIIDGSKDVVTELKRIQVLKDSANANASGASIKTEGITFDASQARTVNDHLKIVAITGGKVTVSGYHPADLPFTDNVKAALLKLGFKTEASGDKTYDIAALVKKNGAPLQIATVKRGDKWYSSIFYTLAENWYLKASKENLGLKAADLQTAITPIGGSSPEDAVKQIVDKAISGDYEGMIGMLPPDEMGVMYDYGKRILAADTPGKPSGAATLKDLQFNTADVTGGKKVSLKSVTVDFQGHSTTVAIDTSANSVTVTRDGKSQTFTVEQIFASSMGSGSRLDSMPAAVRDIVTRVLGQVLQIGLVTTQVNGKWYVSPLRSFTGSFITLLQGMQPGDVDTLLSLLPAK